MDKFKHYDKVIIVAPAPDDNAYLDGIVGIYLRKATDTNDEKSVVRIEDDKYGIYRVITIENKYIKLYDKWINRRKGEDNMNNKNEENIAKENFITKLQEFLGIEDDEKFFLNNDLPCKCYFKNRELRLINKDTNKVFEDENLRNKVFYGLATGTIEPIIEKMTRVPALNDKYYYWDTHYAEDDEDQDYPVVNFDFWRGSVNDYMCYYTGNCFASREACAKNYSVIQRLKNRVFQNNMDKLVVGPDEIAVPSSGTIEHKAVRFSKPVGVFVLECGKDEYGKPRYFAVFDREFCDGSPDNPFTTIEDLPTIHHYHAEFEVPETK